MTERTVEVETTETETVSVCDECGLGDDADGYGSLLEYYHIHGPVAEDRSDMPILHFHSKCLSERVAVDGDGLITRRRDVMANGTGHEPALPPFAAVNWFVFILSIMSAISFVFAYLLWSLGPIVAGVLCVIGMVLFVGAMDEARDLVTGWCYE